MAPATSDLKTGNAVVAYFDILGTKQRFKNGAPFRSWKETDLPASKEIERMYRAQKRIVKWLDNNANNESFSTEDRRLFLLSDCGYLVDFVGHPFDVEYLFGSALQSISVCQMELVFEGLLIRGGISFGFCGVGPRFISGPGPVCAFLADARGNPPLLCVDPVVFNVMIDSYPKGNPTEKSSSYNWFVSSFWYDRFVVDGKTNNIYLNYMSDWEGCESIYPQADLFELQKRMILSEGVKSEEAFEKYGIIARLHNYTLAHKFPCLSDEEMEQLSIPEEFFKRGNTSEWPKFISARSYFQSLFNKTANQMFNKNP